MDTDTLTAECGASWSYSRAEQSDLIAAGVTATVAALIVHDCALEPEHDGTHVCSCGASS